MNLADALTVARAASVPFVVLLYAWDFSGHNYWATALFAVAMATDWFDGRIARSRGRPSPLGSLLDPAADKILVLAVLIMLVDQRVVPGWMVALIVVRESPSVAGGEVCRVVRCALSADRGDAADGCAGGRSTVANVGLAVVRRLRRRPRRLSTSPS